MTLAGSQQLTALGIFEEVKQELAASHMEQIRGTGPDSIPFELFIGGSFKELIPHNPDPVVDEAVAEVTQRLGQAGIDLA